MISETSEASGHLSESKNTIVLMAGVLFGWMAIVLTLATMGVFEFHPGEQPTATVFAIAIPLTLFAVAVVLSRGVRAALLSLDPILLVEFQAWRILGGLFLAVYAFGHLPGLFAWPAGLGDIAVGVAAPFMAWKLRNDTHFLKSPRFRAFHYLGLLDFVIAVSIGVIARNEITRLVGDVTSAPMGELPLVLIPTFIVPMFIMLHLISLMQSGSARS